MQGPIFQGVALNSLKPSSVVSLGGISYWVEKAPRWSVLQEYGYSYNNSGDFIPAVVFGLKDNQPTKDGILKKFAGFYHQDDVFHTSFTEGSVLILRFDGLSPPKPTLPETLTEHLRATSSNLIHLSCRQDVLPDGPYFLLGSTLHRAWRLYPDTSDAFSVSVLPAESGLPYEFEPLNAGAYSGLHKVVAVPSRLYFQKSETRPLDGLRVTVKDNYKLSGIVQTMGSRSFARLYGPQTQTAEVVRALVDLGAVIVGTTKMGAYSGSEVPPEKCIDYFPPWNPRGDGYQGPSGSSSGAGSTVASYDWIDIGIGTDSTGSIRMPAASYGLWGLRSTWSSFSMDGIVANVPQFDTVGLLARLPGPIIEVVKHCTNATEGQQFKPSSILYPTDWFPMRDTQQQRMIDLFLDILTSSMGIKVRKLSLESEWSRTGPEGIRDMTLSRYLEMSIYWPNYYDGYHSYDDFRTKHMEKYGHKPYTSPFMTRRWGLAKSITEDQRNRGLEELQVYYYWVRDFILSPGDEQNMILLPLGRPGANYRDTVPQPGGEFSESAYDPIDFCTVLGLPQVVIPIGQNPYESRITDRTEYAPIVATLAGPRGSDIDLLRLTEAALKDSRWPVEVLTGRSSFLVGDNERHVSDSGSGDPDEDRNADANHATRF